ncbi:acyl-CoA synthetase [Bradyrhizobium macuxiense]|uniref:Acyl-CoA synthetase n=1 Tax=Bradyrhizobium macuxiense TaxID=1755647 RepID=A0A125Q6N9_9BRAD|nr:AMP-binding protein [Bradyrhizobium macuxiense]KWV48517.1 acyl-CoA synthetase [Bradyrhizobium macuxiense]
MFVGTWAKETPDKLALVSAASGNGVTYREINDRSNQLAQCLYRHGIRRNDRVAMFMENNLRFMEIVWAALRSGLDVVSINRYATLDEVSYILNDSGAKALITSFARRDLAGLIPNQERSARVYLMCDGVVDGWDSYEDALSDNVPLPLTNEWMGRIMSYTSGTTGRPKGVVRREADLRINDPRPDAIHLSRSYRMDENTVYLSPAPLYHGAPIRFARTVQSVGGTVVMMEKFDALESLSLIERYRVTHSQWVPTMFVRMLRLPEPQRKQFDYSSHRIAIHAAAPCPVEVKRSMIDWWGPIIYEYYGATDSAGTSTEIAPDEWLAHPGSVGRAPPTLHICDEQGRELPNGEIGLIYGEANGSIYYWNDPEKTRSAQNPLNPNLMTTGDVGYLDQERYLYLTDRKAFTIISGGVNIYPQAIEDVIIQHSEVADVAVIGVPNDEMGEEAKAVVQLNEGTLPSLAIAKEILSFAGERLAAYMVPKSVDFVDALPRLPTGKLYKKALRDKYWAGRTLTGAVGGALRQVKES